MQTNIFSLIEELVSMSGSTSDFDTLNSELGLLETEISKIKEEIEELTSSMNDDKYFDASQEIVDRNIELSVSKKLNKLEKEFDELQQKQVELQNKEKEAIEVVDFLKQKIIKTKKTIGVINNRLENSNEAKTKETYSNIFNEEIDKIEVLQDKLEEKNSYLENLSFEVESINKVVETTKREIEQSMSRLMEVRRNLSNKKYYINENLKRKDNDSLEALKSRLSDLETKKLNILTDANYIASEIKDLLIAEENDKALKKLLELVTIIKAQPYMEINDITRLEEELSKLEKDQNELINTIENKEYFGNDVKYLDNRIRHLEELIEAKKTKIEAIKNEIEDIDNNLVINVTNELKNAENEANALEQSIENYHELIKNNNKKGANTLVALKASFNKKTAELKVINDIIERYAREISDLIESSAKLENEDIKKLKEEIDRYNTEIDELNKIKLLSTKTKDAIEQENDKNALKELSDSINLLKHRIRFDKSSQEIYDQIEMILSSKKTSVTSSDILSANDESTHNINENIDKYGSFEDKESEVNNEVFDINKGSVLPELEINLNDASVNLDNKQIEKTLDRQVFDEFEEFELPELENNSEKTQESDDDTSVKELEDKTDNSEEEEEYTFSELDDTNYFSLDEFLKNLDQQ